jgi:hypothetical protein
MLLALRFKLCGPVGEVIERNFIRAVELKRSHRNRTVENRGVITLRIDAFNVFLFHEPKKTAPARIGAFLQDITRDFLGLSCKTNGAIPDQRHIHIEQDALRHAFRENQLRQVALAFRSLLEPPPKPQSPGCD